MFKILLCLFLSCLISAQQLSQYLGHQSRLLLTQTYVTNKNRSQIIQDFCQIDSRQYLYSKYGIDGDVLFTGQVSNYFNLNTSIVDYILDQNWDQVKTEVNNNISQIVFYYGPWMLGLLIALVIWPFLICCCASPLRFPCCCKKQMQQLPYTQVQLKWPAVLALILLIGVIALGTISLISQFKSVDSYNQIACVSGIMVDDLINGNVSFVNKKQFFVGFSTFDTQLRLANSSIGSLNNSISQVQSSSSNYTLYNSQIQSAKNDTLKVPSITGGLLALSYSAPIQTSIPNRTIQSKFPNILGTSTSNGTLVGSAYTSLTNLDNQIQQTKVDADNFTNSVPKFKTEIETSLNSTNYIANQIQQKQISTEDFFITNKTYANKITLAEIIVYACLVFFAVLEVIAIICLVWCKMFNCRLLLYTTCTFLFLLCLVCFAACIGASIMNPVTYYFCEYLDEAISNRTRLLQVMNKRFKTDGAVIGNVSECIATDGTKLFAQSLIGSDVYSTLVYLNNTYLDLINFNSTSTALLGKVSSNFTSLISKTSAYGSAQVLDISDQDSLNQLIKLSKASQYSCLTSGFSEDSWIPSNNQQLVYVNCKISGGFKSNANTCQNSINFNNRVNGCTGCMDTYSIFESNTTSSDVLSSLNVRYQTSDCTTFNTQLSNVWQNFYKPKKDIIGPVEARAINSNSSASTVSQRVIGTISPLFTKVINQIQTTSDSVVNSKYGTLAGLRCGIINQDALLFKSVFCQNAFVYTYYLRVVFAILSFFLLVLSCCSVCVGQRQFKQKIHHLQKQKQDRQKNNRNMEDNLQTEQRLAVRNNNNNNNNNNINNNPHLIVDYNQLYDHNRRNPYETPSYQQQNQPK